MNPNMSRPATSSPASAAVGTPRLRWNWDFGIALSDADTYRLLQILTALLDTRALGKAAEAAGMSYRAAWGLLRHCQEKLGIDLVSMERGRGTRLTEFGASLVEMDGAARLALEGVHAVWEARMRDLISPALAGQDKPVTQLKLYASHDLALADWAEHGRQVPVSITWHGSETALAALARGECDIAGFHVPQAWSPEQLAQWLKRWLKPRLHACVPVMRRTQGLLVARGNPLGLHSLTDIAQMHAKLVNRQRGSGTRILIDQLFAANGIDPGSIDGYAHEEFTHEAVAATIAGGLADVGFGIRAAAERYDLDFVPQVEEVYGFAMRRSALASESGQVFLRRISGKTFRLRLQSLPGYQPIGVSAAGKWEDFLSL